MRRSWHGVCSTCTVHGSPCRRGGRRPALERVPLPAADDNARLRAAPLPVGRRHRWHPCSALRLKRWTPAQHLSPLAATRRRCSSCRPCAWACSTKLNLLTIGLIFLTAVADHRASTSAQQWRDERARAAQRRAPRAHDAGRSSRNTARARTTSAYLERSSKRGRGCATSPTSRVLDASQRPRRAALRAIAAHGAAARSRGSPHRAGAISDRRSRRSLVPALHRATWRPSTAAVRRATRRAAPAVPPRQRRAANRARRPSDTCALGMTLRAAAPPVSRQMLGALGVVGLAGRASRSSRR